MREQYHDRRSRTLRRRLTGRDERPRARSGAYAQNDRQGRALRKAAGQGCRRQTGGRPVQRLDHARQPDAVQLLHDRHGQRRHLAFREASAARDVVAVVFTGSGDKAFCTGGNTKEYAEYYAGNPQEYRGYMRLFNDMVSTILACDKPVVCRVNGMRIGGGQEIGMACDFSIAGDHARFGQAGPVHGSAPDGGATDFLHLYVGYAHAVESLSLCEPWSAHKAYRLGLLNGIAPVYRRADGSFLPNP